MPVGSIKPKPPAPVTRPTVVLSEGGINTGGARKAYDLRLVLMPDGSYELFIVMKLQFFFEAGSGGEWTPAERTTFRTQYTTAVKAFWSGRRIKVLKSGKHVSVQLDLHTQEGGWMWDHWELTVTKIPAGDFKVSYVRWDNNTVALDSSDLNSVEKKAGHWQRGAVHEFGHMLGFDDEYPATSPHAGDHSALMNSGEQLKPRYDETLRTWLDRKLKGLGVE